MVDIIIISENHEASEMLKAARRLWGKINGVSCVELKPGKPPAQMKKAVKLAIRKVAGKKEVLLLTDIYGSTQFNMCLPFVKKDRVEILTGFNLPMLLKLEIIRQKMYLKDLVPYITRYGRQQIRHVCNKDQPKKG